MIWITSTKIFKIIRFQFCLYRLWVLIFVMFTIAASFATADLTSEGLDQSSTTVPENVTSSNETGVATQGNKNDGQFNFMVQEKCN